jgi:DNA-binding PadR family transcriptional regulator
VFLVLFLVAFIGGLIGFFANSILHLHRNIQTAALLVLRLLADYEREMSGEEIATTILKRSMGLISISEDQLYRIMEAQCSAGFLKISRRGKEWSTAQLELTMKGASFLEEATRHLSEIQESKNETVQD